ncbi:MAG TPA: hypothetical protein VHY34_05390 [Caulobacteraceae bacterium]|nr:hypothetical protein [Caulobacteraceae bacterium]
MADFIGSIGVNIHPTQPGYSASNILQDLNYLGLGAVRSHAPGLSTTTLEYKTYQTLANAGIGFDLIAGSLKATILGLARFQTAHPGSILSIEGPNEVNNFPITYKGLTGTAAAVAYQAALDANVHSQTALAGVPVLNFTDNPITAGLSDGSNQHVYPHGGDQPLATVTAAYDQALATMPGEPVYFTETGYFSLPGHFSWEGVDLQTQAKLTLNLIMDDTQLGVSMTYLYDLIDDGPDPKNKIQTDHFGLFSFGGAAKPVAVAIHDLTSILADTGANAKTFTSSPLNYTLKGLPADGDSLVLEKSSGVYDVVVWAEPDIWNATTRKPIVAAAVPVTLSLTSGAARLTVFDPLASAVARDVVNGASVTVAVTDHPLIIQVSNFAAAMAQVNSSPPLAAASIASAASAAGPTTLLAGRATVAGD